jgi:hypothetical protein
MIHRNKTASYYDGPQPYSMPNSKYINTHIKISMNISVGLLALLDLLAIEGHVESKGFLWTREVRRADEIRSSIS